MECVRHGVTSCWRCHANFQIQKPLAQGDTEETCRYCEMPILLGENKYDGCCSEECQDFIILEVDLMCLDD